MQATAGERTGAVRRWLGPRPRRAAGIVLVLLLAADAALIALHLVNRALEVHDALYLDVDHSYSEFLQYVKFFWLVVLALWAGWTQRRWRLAGWILIFGYLLLDDALQLHERVGRWITDLRNPGVHVPDASFGEAVGILIPLAACLILAVLLYREPRPTDRRDHVPVIVLLGATAFFGIGVDLVHSWLVDTSAPGDLLAVVEDGGEQVMVSILVAVVFGWCTRVASNHDRPRHTGAPDATTGDG